VSSQDCSAASSSRSRFCSPERGNLSHQVSAIGSTRRQPERWPDLATADRAERLPMLRLIALCFAPSGSGLHLIDQESKATYGIEIGGKGEITTFPNL
jgi:hypothetical protein